MPYYDALESHPWHVGNYVSGFGDKNRSGTQTFPPPPPLGQGALVNVYYDHSLGAYDQINLPDLFFPQEDPEVWRQRAGEEARRLFANHLIFWNRANASVPALLAPSVFDAIAILRQDGTPLSGQLYPPGAGFPLESFRWVQYRRRNPPALTFTEGRAPRQVYDPNQSVYSYHRALWAAVIGRFAEAPTQIWFHICNGLYPASETTSHSILEQRSFIFEPGLRFPDSDGNSLIRDIAEEYPNVPVFISTTRVGTVLFGRRGQLRHRSDPPYWIWHLLTVLHWRYIQEHHLSIDSEP